MEEEPLALTNQLYVTCVDSSVYLFLLSFLFSTPPPCLCLYIKNLLPTPPGMFPSPSHAKSLHLPVSLSLPLSSFLPALSHPVAPGCYSLFFFSDLSLYLNLQFYFKKKKRKHIHQIQPETLQCSMK